MNPSAWREGLAAFVLPLEAARLLRRERTLWSPALLPLLLSMGMLLVAGSLLIAHAGELYAFVSSWMPNPAADRWFEWLWVAPARAVLHGLAVVLFLALSAAGLMCAYLLASLLAAPFHEWLSRRVERLVEGAVFESVADAGFAGWRDALRSMLEEGRRLLFFLAIQLVILALALVIPGAGLVAPLALTAVTLFFLPLDYASYVLDRRRLLGFSAKRRWAFERIPTMLGYGSAAFLCTLVPGLNLIAMPILVTGGTLLALRNLPALSAPAATASREGTSTSP